MLEAGGIVTHELGIISAVGAQVNEAQRAALEGDEAVSGFMTTARSRSRDDDSDSDSDSESDGSGGGGSGSGSSGGGTSGGWERGVAVPPPGSARSATPSIPRPSGGDHGTENLDRPPGPRSPSPTGAGPWQGPVQVTSDSDCPDRPCLQLGGTRQLNNPSPGFGISRAARLDEGSTASLSFRYQRRPVSGGEPTSGTLTLDLSADAGNTWTTLATYGFGPAPTRHRSVRRSTSATSFRPRLVCASSPTGPIDGIAFLIDDVQIEIPFRALYRVSEPGGRRAAPRPGHHRRGFDRGGARHRHGAPSAP